MLVSSQKSPMCLLLLHFIEVDLVQIQILVAFAEGEVIAGDGLLGGGRGCDNASLILQRSALGLI